MLCRLKLKTISFITCLLVVLIYSLFLFKTSLYVTIPLYIPSLSLVPIYNNQWQYTPPLQLTQPNPKLNAAYITFVDSTRETLDKLRYTVRNIEDVFNKNYHYPYIIFSAEELSIEYKELVSSLTKGTVSFQRVSSTEYGYSKTTSFFKAFVASRHRFKNNTKKIRFKSRLFAGTLYNHQSLEKIDYFWRFEAGTEYTCPINFDPFQYMQDHDKQISFSIASYGQPETVPTVYRQVTQFKKEYHDQLMKDDHNIVDTTSSGDYNYCFFWNNFQIAKTSFFQSEGYQKYFKFMDKQNGIFYESWSDAVIQSLGTRLFLRKDQIHIWKDIGYKFNWFYTFCPKDESIWKKGYCKPIDNFENDQSSCIDHFK